MRNLSNGATPPRGLVTVRMGQQPGYAPRPGSCQPQQPPRTAPQNAMMLTRSADRLRLAGQLREAIALFGQAIATDPRAVAALYGRGMAHEAGGSLADAERDYRSVTALAPGAAAGFAGLASVLAMMGHLDEAQVCAGRAATLGPNDSTTVIAQARCDRLAGDHAAVARRLEWLLERPGIAPNDAIVAFGLLGDALDRLDECDRAFDAYARANQRFAAAHVSPGFS